MPLIRINGGTNAGRALMLTLEKLHSRESIMRARITTLAVLLGSSLLAGCGGEAEQVVAFLANFAHGIVVA